jgi:cytochrome P450
MTAKDLPEFLAATDLTDPGTFIRDDIDEYWCRARAEAPVFQHPATDAGPAFWVLSRYHDVLALYQDDTRFSSFRGNMLPSLHKPGGDPAAGKTLALTDGVPHKAVRAMLLKALTPRSRKLICDRLQARVDELVQAACAVGTFDFAEAVAGRIPIGTVCDLIGFPPDDHPALLAMSVKALTPDADSEADEEMWLARNELLVYCSAMVAERRARPRDDVLSALIAGRVDGRPLTEDEVVLNVYGLLLAGDHTSRLAMTGAVHAFIRYPDQWRALKTGPDGWDSAVDEVLRWTTPMMHVGRTATVDAELGGRLIHRGELVTGWNSSANRDESVFPEPYSFCLARTPNKHLSFGFGPHYCLGSYLGRAELAALLSALRRQVRHIEPCGDPIRAYSLVLQGFSSLPVRFTAEFE